jgi:hypothetical protein
MGDNAETAVLLLRFHHICKPPFPRQDDHSETARASA